MQGRKPKPTALKLLTGNPGNRPLRLDQFSPEAKIPKCPSELKGEARKEWKRVTTELNRYGMIAEVDRGLLAMLCNTWARWIEAESMINKMNEESGDGLFVKTPNGFPVQSPWVAVSNKAIETYKALCNEFGLSPSSRTRIAPQTSQISLELVGGTDHDTTSLGSLMK
jgi:P27 family predicted phage terminase small subunit